MAYNKELAQRIRVRLAGRDDVKEISMFGGRCFMLNGKMLACAGKDSVLCRIGPENHEEAFQHEGTELMVNNGRIMKGFLFVDEDVLQDEDSFNYWMNLCLTFNNALTGE